MRIEGKAILRIKASQLLNLHTAIQNYIHLFADLFTSLPQENAKFHSLIYCGIPRACDIAGAHESVNE